MADMPIAPRRHSAARLSPNGFATPPLYQRSPAITAIIPSIARPRTT